MVLLEPRVWIVTLVADGDLHRSRSRSRSGPVVWVDDLGEIFPNQIRGKAVAVAAAVNWAPHSSSA